MVERRHRRVQELVNDSKYWDAEDLIRNFEEEMQRLEQGLGHVIFDSGGRPITKCVSPLPLTPKYETKHDEDDFTLRVHLPNVEKDDVRLYVTRERVEVRAVSGKKICRPFYLSVDTPWGVDSDDAAVKFEHGILSVKLKKLKKTRLHVK